MPGGAPSRSGCPSRRCPEQAHQHQHQRRQLGYTAIIQCIQARQDSSKPVGPAASQWWCPESDAKQVPRRCQADAKQMPSRCRGDKQPDEAVPSSQGDARAAKRARTGGAKITQTSLRLSSY
jgi:hypothetical protein